MRDDDKGEYLTREQILSLIEELPEGSEYYGFIDFVREGSIERS